MNPSEVPGAELPGGEVPSAELPIAEPDLGPGPILEAIDRYRGAFVDLDAARRVEADEIRRSLDHLEKELLDFGVEPGARIVLAVGNGPAFVTAFAAALRAGACPLPVHADTPPRELVRTAELFGAGFVVSDAVGPQELAPEATAARTVGMAPWDTGVVARIGATTPEGHRELEGVPLHPTSGTTGLPKLAVRPARAAVEEARHYVETLAVAEDDVLLCAIPMSHAYGFGMCLMVPILGGADVATMRRFGVRPVLEALGSQGVTIYPAAPAALDLLLLGSAEAPAPGGRLRVVTSAGAPLPERTARAVARRWSRIVRPLYGTTETGGISIARPDHDPGRSASVGPAMGGVRVEVRPHGRGDLDAGSGQIWVSSSSLMAGYVGPDGIDRSAVSSGWFETGDLGRLDETGALLLRGRASEVINVFGLKVLPAEVEEVIALLPQVTEVKVYGRPNLLGSTSVHAAVVASGDLEDADIRRHCREHLVAYKRPETIRRLDRLPRSPAGKVVVAELP